MNYDLKSPLQRRGRKTVITRARTKRRMKLKKVPSSLPSLPESSVMKAKLSSTICIALIILLVGLPIFEPESQKVKADLVKISISENFENIAKIEGNSFLPLANPSNPEPSKTRKIRVVVTAYSSTIDQTDSDPFVTAAGTRVREGIVASNLLALGTKIKIPEIFGDKIFVVEDRMSWKKGYYHIDIWFPSYWQALNFGAKRTHIEILEG